MMRRMNHHPVGNSRAGGAVLTTVLLILAVVVVMLVFVKVRAHRDKADLILAGPLFPFPLDEANGFLLTSKRGQFRLDRSDSNVWSLSGGTDDYVDPRAMKILLGDLADAQGGSVLPGTEPEDRRYEFNGPESLRLTVFTDGQHRYSLALGTLNPVTSHYYASGMRRAGCFMVDPRVRERLKNLPRSIELQNLLPEIKSGDLKTISFWRNGTQHLLERRGDRWWLEVPASGLKVLGPDVLAYQSLYQDRLVHDQQGDWVLASDEAVGVFVYELNRVLVREIKPAAETAAWFNKWDLDHPWRKVVFSGPNIDPDPATESPDQMALSLGTPLGNQLIPVARRGVVLLADGQAGHTLDLPLGSLVHKSALTFMAMSASKLEMFREGQRVLAGTRKPGRKTTDGRQQWETTYPTEVSATLTAKRLKALVGELVVDLDRMALVQPLPPVGGDSPLRDNELVEVRLTFGAADSVVQKVFQVGYLKTGVLPAGVSFDGDKPPVGLWRPDTGQLLQVGDGLIITARNFATF